MTKWQGRLGCLGLMIVLGSAPVYADNVLRGAASPNGPTFDCETATEQIQIVICGDPELAKLDWRLAAVYNESTTRVQGKELAALKSEQRQWLESREECAKAEDKRQCTFDLYQARIASLEARFAMVESLPPVTYTCDDKPDSQIVVTYFKTEPQTASLVRGSGGATETAIVMQTRSGSGARFEGPLGQLFWDKGGEALVEWPRGTEFHCKAKS